MGKLNIFAISFANESGVFYAGTIMQGHVTVELTEPMKMRGVKLNFEGKAYVHWTEEESSGTGKDRKTVTHHYSAKEKYFDQDVLLFGSWHGGDTTELQQGRHVFPFQFQLPQGLPSSFEAVTGHVRYMVKAKIDKPWKFDDKTRRPFTIISILDLNLQPNCLQGLNGTKQKHLCCLCCKSGPIEATFHIDRQGFVPGEAIQLFAEISNGASRRMDKSYVELKMKTTFHATTKSKTVTTQVARVSRPGIEGHRQDAWEGEELVIPPLPPSFLVGCNIIDIHYILQLNVDPSGPALDLEIPMEIIIGTIPLAQVVERYPPMPPPQMGMNQWPSAPPAEALYPTAPPSGVPNLPPPSYNECITGRMEIREEDDNEHTRGDTNYAPVYTYYNWGHTPGAMPQQNTHK